MSLLGYINLASNAGDTFTNATDSDMLIYTQSNSQKLLLGVGGGNAFGKANLTISSNLTSFSGDLAITNAISIKGLTITQSDGTTANVGTVSAIPGFSNDNNGVVVSMASNTSNYSFRFVSTSNSLMMLRGDGMLGIGTSNPIAMLDVRSNAQVLGGSFSVGNGTFEFPPQALPGSNVGLSNASYGNGTYITSSSTSNFGAVAPFFSYYGAC